jgi:uncharacterized protein involved in exopolysaccharide biosynthesis
MFRRRAWLIIVPPLLTVFPALIYSSRIANVYESDMLIMIDPQRVCRRVRALDGDAGDRRPHG